MSWLMAPLALLIERLVGYPPWLFRRIGHPVTWIGAQIDWLDRRMNGGSQRRLRGVLALLMVQLTWVGLAVVISLMTRQVPFGWIIDSLLATTLLAQKELARAVRAVADALPVSLESGRIAVSHIVGRDTAALDDSGVASAAIESLAESTSDGIVAPLFWLLLLGLPGIVLYKVANTADSMIGHRTPWHEQFGWAAARFDDLLNLVPARLTALLVAGAAFFARGADPESAWTTALRDARLHASPNAGWPEAAFAGALGLQLGGPRAYQGDVHPLPFFGSGRPARALDIYAALILYWITMNLLLGGVLAVALLLWRATS